MVYKSKMSISNVDITSFLYPFPDTSHGHWSVWLVIRFIRQSHRVRKTQQYGQHCLVKLSQVNFALLWFLSAIAALYVAMSVDRLFGWSVSNKFQSCKHNLYRYINMLCYSVLAQYNIQLQYQLNMRHSVCLSVGLFTTRFKGQIVR